MTNSSFFSILLVLVVAVACGAFAPAMQSVRSETSLNAFEGKKLDASQNAYARGGKPSWVFEAETMFVEEPKEKPKKAAPAKKAAAAAAPKKPFNPFNRK